MPDTHVRDDSGEAMMTVGDESGAHRHAVAATAIAAGSDKADAMYDEVLELMYKHAR